MMSFISLAPARVAAARFVSPVFVLSALTLACLAAQAQVTTLPPVVVTATRFADDADRLPFGVSVITAAQIRDAGVSTVNEALMKLLGVAGRLDFYGGGDYGLDLRGFGTTADSNQVVIVDGVRMSEADIGGTRLAGIAIDSVETIEVIRGNAAVLYGEGATAGAIVITTKGASGKARPSSGYGYLAMGSDSLLDARGGATLVSGGFSLDASVNQRSTDGHRRNFRSSTSGHGLTAQWRNDWLRVGARHAQDELETGLPGSLTATQYEADPSQTFTPNDKAHIENIRNGVFANATFGHWQIGVDAGQRRKLLESMTPGFYGYHIDAKSQGLKVRHSAPVGGLTHTFTTGVDLHEWTRTDAFASVADQESKAFYLKDDLLLPGGTLLSVGARRESVVKTNSNSPGAGVDQSLTAWDAGVVQPLGRAISVYARVGRSFRFANADEFSYVSPGTSLAPQTSRDIDLGVRLAWRGGRSDLRLYRSALRNEIGFDPAAPAPFGGFGANANFDSTLRQGVELEVQQALSNVLQLRVNAAGRQAKFTAGPYDGNDVSLVPRYTASIGLDWQFFAGHKVGGLLNTVSSRSPDFPNACTMPAYATADLRYAFSTSNVELSLGLNNVTDKKYYTQAYSCNGGVTNAIYPEAGRNVVLSVRVSL